MGTFHTLLHTMLRDAFLTDPQQEPARVAEAAPAALHDERLPIDGSQSALIAAQWALVERAFRRDLGGLAVDRVAAPGKPAVPPAPDPAATAAVAAASIDPAPRTVRAPTIERSGSQADPLQEPRWAWPWRREPSVAERKRIVQRKWLVGSAAMPAGKPGVGVASLVAIAAAATVLAFWLMDHRFDGRPPAVPSGPATA